MQCNCSMYLYHAMVFIVFIRACFMLARLSQNSTCIIGVFISCLLHVFHELMFCIAFNALFQVCNRVIEVV